ncbi:MAG: hypothetical protein WBX17_07135 [Microbacterium sp.]
MIISELDRNLLFAVSALIVLGTLTVFIWQLVRSRDRDRDDD